MKLRAGAQLLRLEAITPAHFGAAEGSAALDRPTQKDALAELPYVPDSALKGVLAARYGNPSDEVPNVAREELFGAPDRPAGAGVARRSGRPGALVIGNGELLCFPLAARDALPVRVFPAHAVARFLRGAPAGEELVAALDLLRWIELEQRSFAAPHWPPIEPAAEAEPLTGASVERHGPALVGQLRRLAGSHLPATARLLVAPSGTAAALWRLAAERRTMTALDSAARVVREGSLRTVELIPPATVFLTLASYRPAGPTSLALPGHFQAGAWEGLGLGWLELSAVEDMAAAGSAAQVAASVSYPPGLRRRQSRLDEARLLTAAHAAIRRLREGSESLAFRSSVRSILFNFGPRAQLAGMAAALGFEVAKARAAMLEPTTEVRAHRWVLRALVSAEVGIEPTHGASEPLLAWLAGQPFIAAHLDQATEPILRRWHWLRRFVELGLEQDVASVAEEPV